jgi:MYXO-CTERM domain-containing protein
MRKTKLVLALAPLTLIVGTPVLAQGTGTTYDTTTQQDDDDDSGKWGLLGLLGLAGLLGLKRRDQRDDHRSTTTGSSSTGNRP